MMTRIWNTGKMLVLLSLFLTVALGIPKVNAISGPPSSVFAQWPEAKPVPTVKVSATRQTDGRWQVTINAAGFVFSDICTTVDEPQAVGHAHVYEGDTKIGAAYAPITQIGPFAPGKHRISVVLRAQDHRTLVGPSGIIKAEIVLEEPSRSQMLMAALAD